MNSTDMGRLKLPDILSRSLMLMSDSAEAHRRTCDALRPDSAASSSALQPSLSITHFSTPGLILIDRAMRERIWRRI